MGFIKPATGDIISFSGKGLISNIIKLVTKSSHVHTGVLYIDNGDYYIVDIAGFRKKPFGKHLLKDVLKSYRRELKGIYRDSRMTSKKRNLLIENIQQDLQANYDHIETNDFKYDYTGAFSFAISLFKDHKNNKYKWCTEYVCELYQRSLLPVKDNLSPGELINLPCNYLLIDKYSIKNLVK